MIFCCVVFVYIHIAVRPSVCACLLYTSDAADEHRDVVVGGGGGG